MDLNEQLAASTKVENDSNYIGGAAGIGFGMLGSFTPNISTWNSSHLRAWTNRSTTN
jgi:hypothetical protein